MRLAGGASINTSSSIAGVDVPDVRVLFKWRLGSDIGEMLNMVGRASRDRQQARIVFCLTERDTRRPRVAPLAPTEALVRRGYHELLWAHALGAELASGRGAWPLMRSAFGEPPAATLGPPVAGAVAPTTLLLDQMSRLLFALLRALEAAGLDSEDPQCRAPPPGASAIFAEMAVAYTGPRSGALQEWVHEREARGGAFHSTAD